MKSRHFIAPALAALAGVFWIVQQGSSLTQIEKNNHVLRERIQKFENSVSVTSKIPPTRVKIRGKEGFKLLDGTYNWDLIFEILGDNGGDDPNSLLMSAQVNIEVAHMMDENSLADGISEIDNSGLTEDEVNRIKSLFFWRLASINPLMALDLSGSVIASSDSRARDGQLNSLKALVAKDPTSAAAWLDKQGPKEEFVSKFLDPSKNQLVQLESILLNKLLQTDLAAAQARFATFPPEYRSLIFAEQWSLGKGAPDVYTERITPPNSSATDAHQAKLLELARQSFDEYHATQVIANMYVGSGSRDITGIARNLSTIPFSETERRAILEQAIRVVPNMDLSNPKSIATAYEWAQELELAQPGASIARNFANQPQNPSHPEVFFKDTIKLASSLQDPAILTEYVRRYAKRHGAELDQQLKTFNDQEFADKFRAIQETLPSDSE